MDSPSTKSSTAAAANTQAVVATNNNNSNGAESDRDMLMADEELLDESAMMEEDVAESERSVNGDNAAGSGRRGSTSSSGYRRTSSRQVPGKKEGFYQENSTENAPQDGNAARRASFASTANSQSAPGLTNTSEGTVLPKKYMSLTLLDRLATYKEALERIKSLESVLSSNKSV